MKERRAPFRILLKNTQTRVKAGFSVYENRGHPVMKDVRESFILLHVFRRFVHQLRRSAFSCQAAVIT